MGLLIANTDFIGDVRIAQDIYSKEHINQFIARYEESYLIKLLGSELFTLFKADIDPITKQPNTQIYKDIYNPIIANTDLGLSYDSIGMKPTILYIIWYLYIREQKVVNTIGGDRVNKVEVSREASFDERMIYRQWNMAVDGADAIQKYCNVNPTVYPTFNGDTCNTFKLAHWSF